MFPAGHEKTDIKQKARKITIHLKSALRASDYLIVPTKKNVFTNPLRFTKKVFPGKPGAKTPASLFSDLNGYTFEPTR